MKLLSRIDWTDATRQGDHTAFYTDAEIFDYFKTYKWLAGPDPVPPASEQYWYPRAVTVGTDTYLNFPGMIRFGVPPYTYLQWGFVTKEWLPKEFVIEFEGAYDGSGYAQMCTLVDDYDGNYAEVPNIPVDVVAPWLKFWLRARYYEYKYYRRAPNDSIVEIETITDPVDYMKYTFIRRNGFLIFILFLQNGQWRRGMDALPMSLLKNGDLPDRFAIMPGAEIWAVAAGSHVNSIGITGYKEHDIMVESPVGVTSTGTVVGTASEKIAVTERLETSYIELDPTEEINIDLTGAAYDTDVWCLDVVSDCTDANPLDIFFSQDTMGAVFSGAVQIGDTKDMRSVGEKIDGTWTNTLKYVFYHELKWLLALSMNISVGYRNVKIKNNSAVVLKVYLVRALKEFENSAVLSPADDLKMIHVVAPAEAPLGSVGTVQTLQYQNTSGFTVAEVWLTIHDDGTPLDGTIQYAVAPGGPWYDTGTNPPPDPVKGVQIGTIVADGDKINWYIRTNLPSGDPTLTSFISMFKFYVKV